MEHINQPEFVEPGAEAVAELYLTAMALTEKTTAQLDAERSVTVRPADERNGLRLVMTKGALPERFVQFKQSDDQIVLEERYPGAYPDDPDYAARLEIEYGRRRLDAAGVQAIIDSLS